ncbi:MAG: hypothetical protein ACOCVG_03785 [Verrucomicrobiota bacterium]
MLAYPRLCSFFSLSFFALAALLPAAEPGFFDGFERPTGALADNPGVWTTGGVIDAQIVDGAGVGSSKALALTTSAGESGYTFLSGSANWHPAIFKSFHGQLAPRSSDPAIDSSARTAFYLTTDGDIRARSGSDWVTIDMDPNLDTNAMHYLSMRLDFVEQTWKLWVNDALVTPTPLDFANAGDTSAGLRIAQDGSASSVFDDVSISSAAPSGLNDLNDYNSFAQSVTWNNAASSATGDANGNGISNAAEYAMGILNPAEANSLNAIRAINIDTATDSFQFTFQRRRDAEDITIVPYFSTDLSNWAPLDLAVSGVTISEMQSSPPVDEITVQHAMNELDEQGFIKLEFLTD